MKQQRKWQRNVGQRNEVIPLPRRGLISRSHDYSAGNWSTHNYYHADGNGNVTYLVDGSQGLAASYRYDAYGNLFGSSGSLANDNVYRFSSKAYMDPGNTGDGLYYYGYRFYAPNLQRWLNRDPIGEKGGINLFGFVQNDPENYVDPDGLDGTNNPPKPAPPKPQEPKPNPTTPGCPPGLECQWPSAEGGIKKIPEEGTAGAAKVGKMALCGIAKAECLKGCEAAYGLISDNDNPAYLKACKADCNRHYKDGMGIK